MGQVQIDTQECAPAPQYDGYSDVDHYYKGFPRGKDKIVVNNPKDIVLKARESLDDMELEFNSRQIELGLDVWYGWPEDLVRVL